MSEDDKTDDQKAIGDMLKDWPNPKPGAGSPRRILTAHGNPSISLIEAGGHSITSVAYTSAELFRPDQADLIKGYMQSLKKAEKADVFALAGGKVQPEDVGIQTPLESDVTQTYAEFELGERELSGSFRKDIWKYAIGAVIMLIVWGIKELLIGGNPAA
jgi:hypothetical protein